MIPNAEVLKYSVIPTNTANFNSKVSNTDSFGSSKKFDDQDHYLERIRSGSKGERKTGLVLNEPNILILE